MGDEAGRRVAVVGDALTRSLAAEAGLETYASVDDACTAAAPLSADTQLRSATIHVVRGAPDGHHTEPRAGRCRGFLRAGPNRRPHARSARCRRWSQGEPPSDRASAAARAATLVGIGVISRPCC